MRRSSALPLALAATAALLLGGCAATAREAVSGDSLRVVATTTQMADFTRQVVGEGGEVTQLIQPNASAHSFDPSPADLSALAEADVLIANGLGLEEWLGGALESSGFAGLVVDTGEHLGLEEHASGEHAEDAGHAEEADHAEGGGAGEGAEKHADDEHSHDHSGVNPHVWTDPHLAIEQVHAIAEGLAEADPEGASTYEENADAYIAVLEELDDWTHEAVEAVPAGRRLLVSDHDAFGHFTEAYGITFVGSVIPGSDDNAEPSVAEIDALVERIRETGATAVFSEASLDPSAAEMIAREAGVTVYSGEEALYADSLGTAGSAGETYVGSQVHNVRVLLESWGVTPAPLPAAVEDAMLGQ